ncbi:M81 family metallopeptidase [Cupriavidus basilensis]
MTPVAAVVDCEMVVTIRTNQEPARSYVDQVDGAWRAATVSCPFPWRMVSRGAMCPDMGTRLLVYADGDAGAAQRLARRLADELIGMREQLTPACPGPDEAIDQALAYGDAPVVIADAADNPGGGAPGDATFILHRLAPARSRQRGGGPPVGSRCRAHCL